MTAAAPWTKFHERWAQLQPPLRPNAEVADAIGAAIAGHEACALLLGLTPELSEIAQLTLAADWSETMLERVWPGDTPRRRAVQANWLHLPFVGASFTAAIGDGSLNCLIYPDGYRRLFTELPRVLAKGARLAIRSYTTPAPCESLGDVRAATMAGKVGAIDALKWRIANALAHESGDPNVAVASIYEAFQWLFPDRATLARACHWTREHIEQIDRYANLPDVFSFPHPKQLLAALPPSFANGRLVSSGTYELAERCPILIADFQG